jgi:hypothetical protein
MATYYINADTGNDTTGDGSQGNPWLTINYAVSQIAVGEQSTIFAQNSVAAYTFSSLNFSTKVSKVQGESASGVVFDANNVDNMGWTISGTIDQCTFINARMVGAYKGMFFGTFTISNCIFHDIYFNATQSGIAQGSGTHTFISCIFYNYTNAVNGGFFGRNDGQTVYTNLFSCVFYLNQQIGTLWGNPNGDNYNTMKNSIVYNNSNYNFSMFMDSTTIEYCCAYAASTGVVSNISSLPGCINTDPIFVDHETFNFNLSPSSPCIDAGTLI